jgi:hypothetical protein
MRATAPFIGGSDARIVMGDDEAALLQLWREKRGRGGGLIWQPDRPAWHRDRRAQSALVRAQHRPGGQSGPTVGFPPSQAVDGGDTGWLGRGTGAVFEAKFMLPWTFSEEAAAEKHIWWPQMGRDHRTRRSALPAPVADGREEVLALRGDGRYLSPFRDRAASAADRGSAGRRYELSPAVSGAPERRFSSMRRPWPSSNRWCQRTPRKPSARRKSGAISFDLLGPG